MRGVATPNHGTWPGIRIQPHAP